MNNTLIRIAAFSLLALALSTGCMSLSKPTLAKSCYVIDCVRTGEPAGQVLAATVKVRRFILPPEFDGNALVYRMDEHRYQSDFYHVFFIPPADALTELTRQWLAASGVFTSVPPLSSSLAETYRLESYVTDVSGDYRNPAKPKAVLAIEFALVNVEGSSPILCFHHTYQQAVEIPSTQASDLVTGLGQALSGILTDLEKDLAAVQLPAVTP